MISKLSLWRRKWVSAHDENHQGYQENVVKALTDHLHIHGGSITRARTKKMQAALNGLIEKI